MFDNLMFNEYLCLLIALRGTNNAPVWRGIGIGQTSKITIKTSHHGRLEGKCS